MPAYRPRHAAPIARAPRRITAALLAMLTALAGFVVVAPAASAAPPEYQITGQWAAGTPTQTSNGNLVTAVWRVNVNDSADPPANDPVPNVNFSVTVQHGKFASLPAPCKTAGVTPVSSISADGATLICNLGTVKEGTAEVVQAPMVVNGATGQQITATGTIAGQSADVPPIPIRNVFREDMLWGTPTGFRQGGPGPGTNYGFDLEWTLRTAPGSDAGPNSVSYNLTITNNDGRSLTASADASTGPVRAGCTPFNIGDSAPGHPWSGRNTADQTAPFVTTCTLTRTDATHFRLTLTGIDYSKTLLPTKDSTGASLGTVWQPVASGSIWLTLHNMRINTGVTLRASAPTYRSPSGLTSQDATSNNTATKTVLLSGDWSSDWNRGYTRSGGSPWDNSYRVPQGTAVQSFVTDRYGQAAGIPNTAPLGECAILDVKYSTFTSAQATKISRANVSSPLAGAVVRYYVGSDPTLNPNSPQYNPNAFQGCGGSAGWVASPPANLATVKAVRMTFPRSAVAGSTARLVVNQTIKANAPVGQDVWEWGATLQGWRPGAPWIYPARDTDGTSQITPVPGSRYRYTTGARDVLHISGPTPIISKSANPRIVTPGVPATFTLRYQMQGGPNLRFDNVRIVDTLPAGMTYVPGSANPEPTTVSGRTLTWVLNGVPSNTQRTITYQATVAGVPAGQALTNNVTMTYGNQTARASAQVTVSTSGSTALLKTSDLQYIPNLTGDGSGSDAWTITLTSNDPLPQAFTDTIDVLPYAGDGRGTSFSGSYTLGQITAPAGATVYYTTADPATLSDDPHDASNGGPGTVAGNTVGWSTTYTPDATAIRVIGPQLAPGATLQFKVPITTSGAKAGDLYVNRAQAAAGHTQLVMRTSAQMTMAQYYSATLKKFVQDVNGEWHDANGPADFPAFHYGDTIHYRVVVTNTGQGTLTDIDVSDDKQPQLGAFHIDSLPSGQSQSHEYSITLDTSVSGSVVNTACAKAATPPDMTTAPDIPCDPAGFDVTNYVTTKVADPASGTPVAPGGVIHYTITVTQQGNAPADAVFSDDLSKVLDDADYNNDVKADIGTVTFRKPTLSWAGTVPVGQVATITYSVTVHDVAHLGDTDLVNPVTSPGCKTPADCTTDHKSGYYTYSKVSDPKSGSDVGVGDTITYTVVIVQHGKAPVTGAQIDDDMTKALDDATYGNDAKPSAGTVSYAAPTLTWKGNLAVGARVTITYTMTVTGHGDEKLANVVTNPPGTPGVCDTTIGCRTHHRYGKYTFAKVADPASGSTVAVGDKVTYTVTITQHGVGGVPAATVTDDLSQVLDDATYDNDATASAGAVSVAGPRLTWTGDLAVGQTVRITYSVTVKSGGDGKLANVVTSPDKRGSCDTTIGCKTQHTVSQPAGGLAYTGDDTRLQLIVVGLLLSAGGALTVAGTRRRSRG